MRCVVVNRAFDNSHSVAPSISSQGMNFLQVRTPPACVPRGKGRAFRQEIAGVGEAIRVSWAAVRPRPPAKSQFPIPEMERISSAPFWFLVLLPFWNLSPRWAAVSASCAWETAAPGTRRRTRGSCAPGPGSSSCVRTRGSRLQWCNAQSGDCRGTQARPPRSHSPKRRAGDACGACLTTTSCDFGLNSCHRYVLLYSL